VGSMRAAHGWLPLVVPAEAKRFRVGDRELAAALADAGAELVDEGADVEIAASGAELDGEADLAIVTVVGPESRAGPSMLRAARRGAHSLRARLRARRERRALKRLGYESPSVVYWDLPDRVRLPGLTDSGPRLPRYALVVGRRGPTEPTAVESALAAAAQGGKPSWASTRAGLVVLAVDASLLRVAIGPTRAEIDNGAASLEALNAASPAPEVADRVPWILNRGRAGLADWSVERLLSGAQAPRDVPEPLYGDCLAFLVGLGRVPGPASAVQAPRVLAETVAEVAAPASIELLDALAGRLEEALRAVPRCFAHGDFFAGNVLVDEQGRLSGVVDWDAAGPGRLPLLDLLHLKLTRAGPFADDDWAQAVAERLLPIARAGGDDDIERYCDELGLAVDADLLDALVYAYWLDYAAYQLRAHPVRRMQPTWIERNVERVLRSTPEAFAR
jgi:aminoglycoside phosphotransferase (APT) family kinase protein